MMASAFVLTAAGTGEGKTTLAAGLARALSQRQRDVQPFKAGPDFIDPGILAEAAQAPCYALDPWMVGEDAVQHAFARHGADSDVALVEGVMGLFDGIGPTQRGSTAHLARLLDAPVVPVIDVARMSGTAAAIAHGLANLEPRLDVAGFLLNRAGSEGHASSVRRAVEDATGRPVFGVLPSQETLDRDERHLGLVTIAEDEDPEAYLDRLAEAVTEHVRIEALLEATEAPRTPAPEPRTPAVSADVRIGVATDACFSFYYPANVARLEVHGAEIVPFSPIHDDGLPAVDGIYLGGGYPELHAEELAANTQLRSELRGRAGAGLPVLAECGGLLYLTNELEDAEGRTHPMCGLLDTEAVWDDGLTIGYVEARAQRDGPLAAKGDELRGHEYHRTRLTGLPRDARLCYELERGQGLAEGRDGWQVANTLASYTHHHFATADPERFVDACRRSEASARGSKEP